jgi:hypothetical protein
MLKRRHPLSSCYGVGVIVKVGVGVGDAAGVDSDVAVADGVDAGEGVVWGVGEGTATWVTASGRAGIKPSFEYGSPSKSW